MQLLIIRHADAGDADEWAETGKPDSERPVSPRGRRQIERGVGGLVSLVPVVDLVASSPYTRAIETTDMLAKLHPEMGVRAITDSLVPDAEPGEFVRWLGAQGPRDVVAAVGHEPNLSTLATWLIAGLDESRIRLRKAGACLISFDSKPARGKGTLQWLLGPKQLRTG